MQRLIDKAPIGAKVSLPPAVAIVCMALVAALSFVTFRSLTASISQVGGDRTQAILRSEAAAGRLAAYYNTALQVFVWEASGAKAELIQKSDALLADLSMAMRRDLDAILGDASLSPEKRADWQAFDTQFRSLDKQVKQAMAVKGAGLNMASMFLVAMSRAHESARRTAAKIIDSEVAETAAMTEEAKGEARRGTYAVAGAIAAAVAVTGFIAWWCARVIVKPLAHAAEIATRVSSGDLAARPTMRTGDETGRVLSALQALCSYLATLVGDIRAAAGQIDLASNEIAAGNADLSQRTEEAASSLQQTASSVEQLTAALRNSAQSARHASSIAREASEAATHGGRAVSEVVLTMQQINAHAKKIGEIIGTIDSIAFQTNILALNAAVEAARAGEQGRGFGVVASEVRSLAQRSASAAREIRQLIGASVEQTEEGSQKAQVAGTLVEKIVGSVQLVDGAINEISRTSSEQAERIEQINRSVSEMDRTTQQNSALVEQAAAAAESMRQQSARLVESISTLRTSD